MQRMSVNLWNCAIVNVPNLEEVLQTKEPIININYVKLLNRADVLKKIRKNSNL